MSTTTYGIITDAGKLLFKGYPTEQAAREYCDSMKETISCRVVEIVTTVCVMEV